MFKKLSIVLGIIVGLFVLAAVLVPLFFDANKYRPEIEKLVEDNMNADLQLGKLKLSLWGGVNINVEKLVLSEKGTQGSKPVVSFNDFSLEISIASLFKGRPDIVLAVSNPVIDVIVEKDGKLNISKLSKPAASTTTNSTPTSPSKSGGSNLPFELSFHLIDGTVVYADEVKKTKTQIDGINFDLNNFALNKPFSFKFDSNLDAKEMKDLTLHGQATLIGTAAVFMGSAGLDHVDLEANLDLTRLVIKYSTLFNKSEKAPLKMKVKLSSTDKNLNLEAFHIEVNDAAINFAGTVSDFSKPVINMKISGSKFNFEHWQEVLAPLKAYDMKGMASFDVRVTGPSSKPEFTGDANAEDISLKVPGLVPRITDLKSTLKFSSDSASLSNTTLKMGDSDLALSGTVKSFTKPVIRVAVESKLLDVDSLLPKVPAGEEQAPAQAGAAAPQGSEKSATSPIQAMKSNPVMRDLDFNGQMKVAKLRMHKAELSAVKADLTFKNLVMTLKDTSAQAFSGTGAVNATIDFRGADPTYVLGGQLSNIDVNAAITNQMPVAKDSLFGKAFAKFDINGAGITKAKVTNALKGKGNFHIDNGSWSALKAMEQVGSALQKIPGAQSAIGGVNITDKFKQLKSDFTINNGKLNIVNMIAEMEGARTAITGGGYVDFDMNMDLQGKIATPAGDDIPKDLKGPDGRLTVPYEIACKATAPCLKMDAAVKLVATAYAKKVGGDALKKAIENNTNNQTVKDLLNKLPF
jgi:uncharacterized protein involved in outer membrane biogenesis